MARPECGRWLWCRVPRLVTIRTPIAKCRNSLHVSLGYFWYAWDDHGASVQNIDSRILSHRAQVLEQHETSLSTEMFWALVRCEGVLGHSKVAQNTHSDPYYEFQRWVKCIRVFWKNRIYHYDILGDSPNSTKNVVKDTLHNATTHHLRTQTRIRVTWEYLWTCRGV